MGEGKLCRPGRAGDAVCGQGRSAQDVHPCQADRERISDGERPGIPEKHGDSSGDSAADASGGTMGCHRGAVFYRVRPGDPCHRAVPDPGALEEIPLSGLRLGYVRHAVVCNLPRREGLHLQRVLLPESDNRGCSRQSVGVHGERRRDCGNMGATRYYPFPNAGDRQDKS